MTSISSPSTSQTQVDRRQEAQRSEQAKVSTSTSSQSSPTQAPTAAAPVAEAQVRTPADAATVEASRVKAAGAEDAAKGRVLAQNAATADASAAPRRGLARAADEPKSCVVTDNWSGDAADLRTDVRGKGSGKGISDDGSECAPALRDPSAPIEV